LVEFDERYIGHREHAAAQAEIKDRIAKLELEQARMNAALMHLPDKVDKLGDSINSAVAAMHKAADEKPPAASSSFDQAALALHHAADALTKSPQRRLSFFEMAALALIGLGLLSIASWLGFVRIGGA